MEDNSTIKIITKEKKEIEITKKAAQLSDLLKNAIIDYQNESSFPINELDEKIAEKIKEYLTHFDGVAPKEIEKPLQQNEMKNVTDEWSANFIDKLSSVTFLIVLLTSIGLVYSSFLFILSPILITLLINLSHPFKESVFQGASSL